MKTCNVCGNETEATKACPFCGNALDKQPASIAKGQKYTVFNIKAEMPTVDEADFLLLTRLQAFKRQGIKVVKIIHGYGSTGVGGELRYSVRAKLDKLKWSGIIKFFVSGEDFNGRNSEARKLTHLFPSLLNDEDYHRNNKGISIAVLS